MSKAQRLGRHPMCVGTDDVQGYKIGSLTCGGCRVSWFGGVHDEEHRCNHQEEGC